MLTPAPLTPQAAARLGTAPGHRVTGSPGLQGGAAPFVLTRLLGREQDAPSGIHGGPVPRGQSLKLLSGKSRCPSARLPALVCSHGQGWAPVSDGAARLAAGPCVFVLLSDLGDAGLHPAGVFGTQDFSKALFTLGLPMKVRPEEQ